MSLHKRLTLKNNGFTLPEILVTTFVLSIGMLSVLLFFSNAMTATQYARDLTVPTSHAEYIFEEMKERSTLANITGTNWVSWAQAAGLNTLPGESVAVAFANTQNNPLNITTTVDWVRKLRANNVSLTTQMTK